MKALVLSLAVVISSSAFAADKASQFVMNTLTDGQNILSLKSTSARNEQLCQLVKSSMDAKYIGAQLLGQYATDTQDQAGINLFNKEMPSMAVTKLISQIGSADGAQITVDDSSTDNGDGTFDVGVSITTSGGSNYNATIVLDTIGKSLKIMDGTYFGISGVNYLGGQIQKDIGAEDQSMPISSYMKKQMADAGYIHCD